MKFRQQPLDRENRRRRDGSTGVTRWSPRLTRGLPRVTRWALWLTRRPLQVTRRTRHPPHQHLPGGPLAHHDLPGVTVTSPVDWSQQHPGLPSEWPSFTTAYPETPEVTAAHPETQRLPQLTRSTRATATYPDSRAHHHLPGECRGHRSSPGAPGPTTAYPETPCHCDLPGLPPPRRPCCTQLPGTPTAVPHLTA